MSAQATLITTQGGWATGLIGTIAFQVLDSSGIARIGRTTAGITEDGGGSYRAQPEIDNASASLIIWDDGINFAAQVINANSASVIFAVGGLSPGAAVTYSIKDGNQIVLLAPTTVGVVEVGGGVYWIKPDPSVVMSGIRTIVWNDGAGRTTSESIELPIGSVAVSGNYGTQDDMQNIRGITNLITDSDLENVVPADGDAIRLQAASDFADGQINDFFMDGPFTVPLSFTRTSSQKTAAAWYGALAVWYLYQAKGERDDDGQAKRFDKLKRWAYQQMGLYKGGVLRLSATRRWPTPTAPVAADSFMF